MIHPRLLCLVLQGLSSLPEMVVGMPLFLPFGKCKSFDPLLEQRKSRLFDVKYWLIICGEVRSDVS